MIAEALTGEAYELLATEAHLLDDREYDGWLELFTEECLYWMPVDPEADDDGTMRLNVFYDDRPSMEDRVTRLTSGNAFTEEPISLTARTFSAVQVESDEAGDGCAVRSNFVLVTLRLGEQRVFGGRCLHRLVRQDGELRIAAKRVSLLGSDAPQRPMTFLF
jgi:3-phenylpropionate/cinnamic acid dioxygenase small subunit